MWIRYWSRQISAKLNVWISKPLGFKIPIITSTLITYVKDNAKDSSVLNSVMDVVMDSARDDFA